MDAAVGAALSGVHEQEWARVVAALARRFGDLDTAEDAAAEAFAAAVERWPVDGVPPHPGGWLMTTATRAAIDRLRREALRPGRQAQAHHLLDPTPHAPTGIVTDDRLRLVFTCCHPALAPEARVALTLRLVGGLSVADIARAFLVRETTMAQRITRAKARIKAAGIPFRVPDRADLDERISDVLAVHFLVFNEGYLARGGQVVRADLCDRAVRLARLTHELLPDHAETTGLLALLLLLDARRDARTTAEGDLVTLRDQDRSRWSQERIAEGHSLVRACMNDARAGGPAPGRFQLLAAINAVHTHAARADETDWAQVLALYDRLVLVDPSPVVRLNRAVAVAELDGPAVALSELAPLADRLDGYHPFHVVHADLLHRAGLNHPALNAYDRAIDLSPNPSVRAHLEARRRQIARGDSDVVHRTPAPGPL